ncbi:hypothetical protein RclHR1_04540005 [Rhizophagus clarus]|uniref:Kinase-like domain-containing protein n=1 Tax=Rhizophagus clarus TaxID=94130 RepID=A0A2Z6RJK4_9GLOM|nr:hypothetical protein RclHR1_04540005 [Rhizophagus clarus]GES90147.1 kinase-like domain-containing protein [Rhizophagus clarus]
MTPVIKWINEKIENRYIRYFEYSEFSQICKIDKGGFGIVRKAHLDNIGLVALKFISSKDSEEKIDVNDELVKELNLLLEVDYHRNINRILGITKDSNNYNLVLEYANEGNLRAYLEKKFTSLKWKDKIQMALDITNGLKFLHSKGIIHRDLHSKNILVNDRKLLIADFGLSKKLAEATTDSESNKKGMIEYIEPQCLGEIMYKKDEKSDIYSLGVLLWEISSGHPPFSKCSPDTRDILGSHIKNGYREDPIEGTPPKYQDLYQECWNGEPKSRPDIEKVYKILSQLEQSLQPIVYNEPNERIIDKDNLNDCDNDDLIISSDYQNSNLKKNTLYNRLYEKREERKTKNLLILGHAGSGKSTLYDVLLSKTDESKSSKDFRNEIFEWEGTKYHIVDGIGMRNVFEDIQKINSSMPEGISQILLTIDGKFTAEEESTFNLLKNSNGIAEYITIVRTKFSNFKNKVECKKDETDLLNKYKAIAKLCKSIVYVDNPPISIIINDKDDKETININEKRRDESRITLLYHLNKVIPEKYYENCDKLFNNIVVGNFGSGLIESTEFNFNNLKEGVRNLIIIGRTNSGKSTLAKVLSESVSSPEGASDIHYLEDSEKIYHVIDYGTKSIKSITKLLKQRKENWQILFVIDGKFGTYETDEVKAIFDNDIHGHITIVRTKFSNFKNEDKCEEDKKDLCEQNEAVAKMCQNIVYVDNLSINIHVEDEDDKAMLLSNRKRRDQSRTILLNYLDKVFQEKKRLKDCEEIANITEEERSEILVPDDDPSEGKENVNYIKKFVTIVATKILLHRLGKEKIKNDS